MTGAIDLQDAALAKGVHRAFADLAGRLLPDAAVADIHSHGFAEDGETLMIYVDLANGQTAILSICPGSPIACTVHE